MGNYPNVKYGDASAGAGGGGGGGGLPVSGGSLGGSNTPTYDLVTAVAAIPADPCLANFTPPDGPITLGSLLQEVPSDATLFTFQDGVSPPQVNLALTDRVAPFHVAPICDFIGVQAVVVIVEDGAQAGAEINIQLVINDGPGVCGGCGGP